MSKVTRIEQLANEDSLYRVSGLFEKSQICTVVKLFNCHLVAPVLNCPKGQYYESHVFEAMLKTGSVKIMCLQRGY